MFVWERRRFPWEWNEKRGFAEVAKPSWAAGISRRELTICKSPFNPSAEHHLTELAEPICHVQCWRVSELPPLFKS